MGRYWIANANAYHRNSLTVFERRSMLDRCQSYWCHGTSAYDRRKLNKSAAARDCKDPPSRIGHHATNDLESMLCPETV